eukprot:scaffold5661_cov118-Isochrysis_galbana.AAC.1
MTDPPSTDRRHRSPGARRSRPDRPTPNTTHLSTPPRPHRSPASRQGTLRQGGCGYGAEHKA